MNPIAALYDGLPEKRDRPALHDGEITLSHGALIDLVEALAADLTARGLGVGARVGLCAVNSWRHVAAYLAVLRAGAVWVPLNPRNGAALNGRIQARAGLDMLLADQASQDAIGPAPRRLKLEDWIASVPRSGAEAPPPIHADPDAAFAVKFTGGTTGEPKGVVQSQASAWAAMTAMRGHYAFTAHDVNLAAAPLTHGSSHYVLPVLAAGGAHVLMAQPDRAAILDELKRRISVAFMPPTLIYLLMGEAAFAPSDFPALRRLTYSAAPMPAHRIGEVLARFGPVLDTLYGQTEAPMTIAGLTPDEMADPALRASVGRPFPGVEIALLDDAGTILGAGGTGEILVRGDLTRTVYLDDPVATAAARRDGWLRTGDVGRLDDQGRLFILGRAREIIISGGYNIYPAEVEQALALHPAVREACAFGVEDPVWGERLEAAVVTANGADDEALLAFVRDHVGPVRTPKRLHRLAALPRNPVGKIVRADVRALSQQSRMTDAEKRSDRRETP